MTPPLFLLAPLPPGHVIRLDGAEGRHAAAVRRLGPGERIDVSDGYGRVAGCEVVGADRGGLDLRVLHRREEPMPEPRLVVVQALAKGGAGELAVQLCTEYGVGALVPWAAERSVSRWNGASGDRHHARWVSAAREAAKQSRRAWWPEVTGLADLDTVLGLVGSAALAVLLDHAAAMPLVGVAVPSRGDIVVIVGPEGGISPVEADALVGAGAQPCRLGPAVLRSATAGGAAAIVLSAASGRWS